MSAIDLPRGPDASQSRPPRDATAFQRRARDLHTFFPEYTTKEWCRTDARYRQCSGPTEFLEMLCDIGAAELLSPEPWFSRDVAKVTNAAGLAQLASTYRPMTNVTWTSANSPDVGDVLKFRDFCVIT